MPTWLLYALLSAAFAGLTSVLAKFGVQKINADLGLTIRTAVVLVLVASNLFAWSGQKDIGLLTPRALLFLVLSGTTTALSWVFYYRAMKLGSVSYVAAIDKGSIVLTILLSVLLLGEQFTFKLAAGAGLILAGMLVLIWK